MDLHKMLRALREEREQIEEAIMTLERLATGRGRRRGRPPEWMRQFKSSKAKTSEPKRRGRPPSSKNKAAETAAIQ